MLACLPQVPQLQRVLMVAHHSSWKSEISLFTKRAPFINSKPTATQEYQSDDGRPHTNLILILLTAVGRTHNHAPEALT